MVRTLLPAMLAATAVGGGAIRGDDQTAVNKQNKSTTIAAERFLFNLRVYEGDPLGTVEGGTLTLRFSQLLSAAPNQSVYFNGAREVPIVDDAGKSDVRLDGIVIRLKSSPVRDGRIQLEIVTEKSTVLNPIPFNAVI